MGLRLHVRSGWTARSDAAPATFELDAPRIVIGRCAGADVFLPHPAVSATHAILQRQGAAWVLLDESSRNGTRVNDALVPPGRPKALRSGDVVAIGGFHLELEEVVLATPTSAERTSALARRLLREAREGDALEGPCVRVLNGERAGALLRLPPAPSSVVLGRGEECDFALPDADASREHVELTIEADGVLLRDLESKNGCFVNDRPQNERWLEDRDEIRLGATLLVFEDPASAALREVFLEPVVSVSSLPAPPARSDAEDDDVEVADAHSLPEGAAPGAATSDDELLEPAPVPVETRSHAPPQARADIVIYLVAGTVLALSAAGLIWLFG